MKTLVLGAPKQGQMLNSKRLFLQGCFRFAPIRRPFPLRRGKWKKSGLLNLNVVVPAQMMMSAVDARRRIYKLAMNDRKLKVHELADIVKISDGSVFIILLKHLGL